MKVSVCITVFNEENNISKPIGSLLNQEKKPDEIVIVDGGSTDKTVELIKHFQKKDRRIKLLVNKCSRAEGRNLAVELSRNNIIAMTDAGCTAKKKWLKNITRPFKNQQIDVVAGFYDMEASNSVQKAMSFFLGVLPSQFDVNFLPSARSVAFKKDVWEKVGGFPSNLDDTAEDTMFNYLIVKEGVNIKRVKNARVEWRMPETLKEFSKKIYLYAKGDAKSGIWKHSQKEKLSHNVKSILKLLRYLFGIILVIFALIHPIFWFLVMLLIIMYSYWAFRKVYLEFSNIEVGLWGIILQYVTDVMVVVGFLNGMKRG